MSENCVSSEPDFQYLEELLGKLNLRYVRDEREKRGRVIFCAGRDSATNKPQYCFKYCPEEKYGDRLKNEFRVIKFLFPVLEQLSFRTLRTPEVIRYSDSPGDHEIIAPHMVLMLKILSLIQEPSLSHKRPLFGCFLGIFSPSFLQILSTHLAVYLPAFFT